MAKVVCESCGTSYKYEIAKDMELCPVCGKMLWSQDDEESIDIGKELSFGEGVELGENDSFDEDRIDFWWYSIKEPSADGTSRGRVYTTCTKCGNLSYATYPVARTKDYLLISPKCQDKCSHCGNELKNHILSKRPAGWVDPRKRDMWVKDYENIPKCPICSSTKIHKISLTNKAASAVVFGVLSAGHVSKTYKCDTCGAKF